ncbi:uncharacterized protein LOC129373381 [Poeciliopsis prolifica]|uniref:uncharacterized protein LOC129373381 n=1 Tax=Poeciliopsis prolifica TaxID=188132 RepID=UPI0024137D91|nr:uncharacterized protein LOC129373381 [Poeciliopsis prolifica]
MQSILNLNISRRFVAHYPEAVFGALSGTPLFASLFCTAMQHPGKYFSPEEIYKVQMEVSKSIESVGLAQEDDLTNFLSALLVWLNPCGMNTSCMLYTAIACEKCQEALLDIRELGPILYLPPPLPYDSITSLLNRWVSETYAECCDVCFSNLKRKDILNHTDVIALHLPRSYNQVDLKYAVTPSLTIDIPVKTGTQLYRLSSVICRQTLSPQIDHFYTYLMCGQLVFKADDDQVTISNTASAADICHNGFIYVYEKYTEGQDNFSVGFKETTVQRICNPEFAVNTPIMAKSGANNYNSEIDATLTKNDKNTCFEAEETNMENTINMAKETYCCTHDGSPEDRSTIQDETGARDLVQEEMITKDETDTNDEEIICETHSDFSQNLIITEDEISDFSEDDIENSTDYFYRAEDNSNRTNCNLDPTMCFCRFSNSFNNCWMNAAMQSILNLNISRRFVAHYPEAVFGALSGTPLFASLFRTAMYHPGKYFSPEEIYKVQMELSKSIESEALLDIRELGPILYLPPPLPYDSITSLLNRWVSETYAECCDVCFSNLKRKDILNHTDVIALHLPRSYNQVDLTYPVTPSLTIDIPVKTGTQLYRLSSVICRQT